MAIFPVTAFVPFDQPVRQPDEAHPAPELDSDFFTSVTQGIHDSAPRFTRITSGVPVDGQIRSVDAGSAPQAIDLGNQQVGTIVGVEKSDTTLTNAVAVTAGSFTHNLRIPREVGLYYSAGAGVWHPLGSFDSIDRLVDYLDARYGGDQATQQARNDTRYQQKTQPAGSDPLAALNMGKLRMSTVEAQQVAASGGERELLNVTGPGCVYSLWMAVAFAPALDGRIRVYYDGATTPAVDVDLGTLLGTHYSAASDALIARTPHASVDFNAAINNQTGFQLDFAMPFGSSIRVTFYNPTTVATGIYSMITYRLTPTDLASGMRLRSAGARLADQLVTRTAAQATQLASIVGKGSLVWHSMIGGINPTNSAAPLSWMERNIQVAVDGETTPAVTSSGTEDWYDSAWYFNGRKDYNPSLYSWVGTDQPSFGTSIVAMVTDLLGKYGGIPFTTSCVVTALTETACTTGDKVAWAILYYGT